jgi:hypothetical protein
MKKFMVLVLAVLLVTAPLIGCAGWKFDQQSPVLELAVRAGTGRVLHENPSWTQPAHKISGDAIRVIESGELVDLKFLESYVVSQLPDSMLPEEQALAIVIIGSIRTAIINELEQRGTSDPQEIKVFVLRVLTWINETAGYRL